MFCGPLVHRNAKKKHLPSFGMGRLLMRQIGLGLRGVDQELFCFTSLPSLEASRRQWSGGRVRLGLDRKVGGE